MMRSTRPASVKDALLAAAAMTLGMAFPAVGQLEPGSKIPPLTVKTLSGQTINLHSFFKQNQAVVLSFWAKFLPLSSAELPALEKLNAKYAGVQMLGFVLDLDTKADLDDYLKRLDPRPTFEMCGKAVATEVAPKLGVQRHPTVYVVNSACVVSYSETGFSAKSAAQIEAALKRILNSK